MATTTKTMAADTAKCPRGLEPPMDGSGALLYFWLHLRLKDAGKTPSDTDPNFPSPFPHLATDFRFPGMGRGWQGDRVRSAAPGVSGPTGRETVRATRGYSASPVLRGARGWHSVRAERTRRPTDRGRRRGCHAALPEVKSRGPRRPRNRGTFFP